MNILYTIIIYPLVLLVEVVYVFAERVFKITGFSVLCISVAISVLCFPLYAVAEKWQETERLTQSRLKNGIDRIKSVFKGDEQYMILSTFYKQNHYHPIMALRSSFGLLIQIPFFIAAYSYLSNLEALRGVSFGFLKDLGAPDYMFHIGSFNVNVLPIAMTAINCVAGAIYTRGLQLREKLQVYGMAAIFLVLLYNSPSGLVMYWTMNNIFSLLKNIYYKVNFQKKNYVLFALLSLMFLLVAVYLNYTGRGSPTFRKILTLLFSVLAVFIFLVPFIGKLVRKFVSDNVEKYLSPKSAMTIFFINIISLAVICGIFVPSNLIGASPQEFSYIGSHTTPLFFILNSFMQSVGVFVFWPVCLYFLFSDNTKRIFVIVFSSILLASLVNFFFFVDSYGFISNTLVFDSWGSPSFNESIFNLLAMLIPFVFVVILFVLKKYKILTAVSSFMCLALFVASLINVVEIDNGFKALEKYQTKDDAAQMQTVEPIFSLSSKGKNVVVLMLDRAVSVLLPEIVSDYPWLEDALDGFVFYPNTVSFNGYTSLGSPPVFGGYEYIPTAMNERKDVPILKKRNEALMLMPVIFSENGFSVTATDLPYANGNWIPDMSIFNDYSDIDTYITDAKYTDLWIKENNFDIGISDGERLVRNILFYSIFKISPCLLREAIYNKGDWCSVIPNSSLRLTLNGYAVLDYMPRLCRIKNDDSNNALVMTNNLTHEGSLLQAPDYIPAKYVTEFAKSTHSRTNAYSINAAALMRLSEWFDYLKQNDVYDNTRIILVSDHGPETNIVAHNSLPFQRDRFNAFLMVKDFSSRGRLKADMTFMTNADVPALATDDLIENPVNPFTGNPINSDAKESPLYIVMSGDQILDKGGQYVFSMDTSLDYYVSENIFEDKNWVRADK